MIGALKQNGGGKERRKMWREKWEAATHALRVESKVRRGGPDAGGQAVAGGEHLAAEAAAGGEFQPFSLSKEALQLVIRRYWWSCCQVMMAVST